MGQAGDERGREVLGGEPARWAVAARCRVAPSRGSSTAAAMSSARAAGNDEDLGEQPVQVQHLDAAVAQRLRRTRRAPPARGPPTGRRRRAAGRCCAGVSRRSSGPGRCSSTVRRRPTSLVAPIVPAVLDHGQRLAHSGRASRAATRWIGSRSAGATSAGEPTEAAVDLFDLTGKVAVVTGGTRGIGLMMARGLLQAGARVYISSRKADAGEAAVAELSAFGDGGLDPGRPVHRGGVPAAGGGGRRLEDQVHILVNNAGATWGEPLATSPSRRGTSCSTSTSRRRSSSPGRSCRCSRRRARDDDPARVVNVGSIDGLHVPPMHTYSYSSSKAALHHLTRVLAKELGPRRITVNAVAPGPFESKMMHETLEVFGKEINNVISVRYQRWSGGNDHLAAAASASLRPTIPTGYRTWSR